MKVTYDPEADAMMIAFSDDRIKVSDEIRSGVIADFSYEGGLVRLEILGASKIVRNTGEMQFAVLKAS